jgi:thioredoxin-dependent peroxiredoxin
MLFMTDTAVRLAPGDQAPDFTLPDSTGTPRALADYRGRKVVLYFYPAAMTPGCTTEACDFRDNLNSLEAAGYQVIGISKDRPEENARFAEQEALNFPLLSDPTLEVHRAYAAFGEKSLYGKTVEGTIRSTFVIDEHGRVSLPLYNVKATGHVASLRKKLGVD